MLTITNGLRERDAIETLKAQLLELLAEDQEIRDAIAALLQREDKIRRVFI
jgi:prefoldin subunit 5